MPIQHDIHRILRVRGPDAASFLQGQLTADITQLTPHTAALSAHCNREGRMVSLFHIFLHAENYYLRMPDSLLPIALAALKKYAVFSKVSLEIIAANDLPIPDLPYSHFPALYPATSGKFLPHEFQLQDTHAISFDKGCYTGQEIIARMHYRGKPKRSLYQVNMTVADQLAPGTSLYYQAEGQCLLGGTVLDVIDQQRYWLHCHEVHAKHDHLFLESNPAVYAQFIRNHAL
jgi:folate-binding protein YgfZ